MPISIQEQYLQGKTHTHCEDNIVITSHYVAVLDGATSKSEVLYQGKTPGEMAVNLLKEGLQNLPPHANCESSIEHLNQSIQDFYQLHILKNLVEKEPEKRTSASAAIYSDYHKQVWLIGDCQCLIGNTLHTNKKAIDQLLSELRAYTIESELAKGKRSLQQLASNDHGRKAILAFLRDQHQFQNSNAQSPYGYSVLDGFPLQIEHIKILPIDSKQVVLATDGYPKLYSTLQESEEYLKQLLQKDPMCFREHKSTKGRMQNQLSFDDRAYVRFLID